MKVVLTSYYWTAAKYSIVYLEWILSYDCDRFQTSVTPV